MKKKTVYWLTSWDECTVRCRTTKKKALKKFAQLNYDSSIISRLVVIKGKFKDGGEVINGKICNSRSFHRKEKQADEEFDRELLLAD